MIPLSQSHNWLSSPSRSNKGAVPGSRFNGFTSPPCPQKTGRVHLQVAAGQKFPIEWASGHGFGSSTYIILMKAEDEMYMKKNTFAMLDDYIDNAPVGSNIMDDEKAYHVTNNGPSSAGSLDQEVTTTFNQPIGRPKQFRNDNSVTDPRVYTKKAQYTQNDKRVMYTNAKYPWIISMHRFRLQEDKPDEMDLAFMEIPTSMGSGKFVIQYMWNGYYDCVDINVLDVLSTDIWGSAAAGGTLDRIDHCFYTPGLAGYQVQQMPNNDNRRCIVVKKGEGIEQCQKNCLNNNQCDSVQVTPWKLQNGVVKFPGMHQAGTSHLPQDCLPRDTSGMNEDDLLCYMIQSGDPPEVGPAYKIMYDPEDPVFYSTCYNKQAAWEFKQTCTSCRPAAPQPGFKFDRHCISCYDMKMNMNPEAVPRWTISDKCEHCDPSLG